MDYGIYHRSMRWRKRTRPVIDLIVIGGTGVYELAPLTDVESLEFETPFGPGSGPFQVGNWCGKRVAFLARHGEDHRLAPHEVNYKANLLACAELEPGAIIAVNAVGSMNASLPPAGLVLPDQIIDYTWGRDHTFSGNFDDERGDTPLHIDFTEPYSAALRQALIEASNGESFAATTATYAATQGPRLETAAEIQRLINDGCDIVGMTGMPEAALARELELNYASIAIVANWAAGFPERGQTIALAEIVENVEQGARTLVTVLKSFLSY